MSAHHRDISQAKSPLRRIGKGLGASWIGQGTSVASRLLEVPVVIAFWGVETYGIWLILNVIPTLLTASDFGIGSVTDRVMARELKQGQREEAISTFQTSMLISIASSMLLSGLTVLAFAGGLAQQWIGATTLSTPTAVGVSALLSARVVTLMISRVSQAALFSIGRYPRAMLMAGLGDVLGLAAFFAAVVCGGGIMLAAWLQLAAAIAIAVILQWQTFVFAPWLPFGIRHASLHKLRELASPAFASFSLGISRSLNYSMPRVVVSMFGGPAAATIFHAHRQLARLVNFMILFSRPFQAELALVHSTEDDEEFIELSMRTVQLFVWLALGSTLAVVGFALLFFGIWTHHAFGLEPALFGILLATTLFEALGSCGLIPVAAINRHQAIAWTFLVANAVGLALAMPFTRWFGLTGMAAALMLVDVATCVRTFPLLGRIVRKPTTTLLKTFAMPPFWVVNKIFAAIPRPSKPAGNR